MNHTPVSSYRNQFLLIVMLTIIHWINVPAWARDTINQDESAAAVTNTPAAGTLLKIPAPLGTSPKNLAKPGPQVINSTDGKASFFVNNLQLTKDITVAVTPYKSLLAIPNVSEIQALDPQYQVVAGADIIFADATTGNPITNEEAGFSADVYPKASNFISTMTGPTLVDSLTKGTGSLDLLAYIDGAWVKVDRAGAYLGTDQTPYLATFDQVQYAYNPPPTVAKLTGLYPFVFVYKEADLKMSFDLSEGWNLISLNQQPTESSIQAIIAGHESDIVSVWKYDATNNQWLVALPKEDDGGASYAAYEGTHLIEQANAGDAMWLNVSSPFTLTIKANQVPFETMTYPANGWKVLGMKGSNQCASVQDLIPKNDHVAAVHVWKWDGWSWNVALTNAEDGGEFYAASKAFAFLKVICPGEGFYLRVFAQQEYETWPVETPPAMGVYLHPPKNFLATPGDGAVTVSWAPQTGGTITGYKISQNNGSELVEEYVEGVDKSSFKFTNLKNDTKYEYKIQTYSTDQYNKKTKSIYSDLVSTTPAATQPASNTSPVITSLSASNDSIEEGNSVTFTWAASDVDGQVVGYLYSVDDGTPSQPITSLQKVIRDLDIGPHTFFLQANDNLGASSPIKTKSIIVTPKAQTTDPGQLILIVGGPKDEHDTLWPMLKPLAESIYNTFISRGFDPKDIFYSIKAEAINDKIDDNSPTKDELMSAITTWAGPSNKQGPLYIYLMDHGYAGSFFISDKETISAASLKSAIDSFLTQNPNRQVILVIEACRSGSFKEQIEGQNIVVVSSAAKDIDENVDYSTSFTKYFNMAIRQGLSIKKSFDLTQQILAKSNAPYSQQNPQLGDYSSIADSVIVARPGSVAGDSTPVVKNTAVTTVNNLSTPSPGEVVKISAEITGNTDNLRRVWAVVTPPNFSLTELTDGTPVDPNFPKIELGAARDGHFEAFCNVFVQIGTYQVMVVATNGEGDVGTSDSFDVTVIDPDAIGSTTTTTTSTSSSTTMQTVPTTTTTTVPNSLSLSVDKDWNLLSSTIGFEISAVFGDSQSFTSIWKWADDGKGAGAKTWAVCLVGEDSAGYATSKGFLALSAISSGEGFWVNSKQAKSVEINGEPDYSPLTLVKGWNLVGIKGTSLMPVSEFSSATSVWKWTANDKGVKTWAVYLPNNDGGATYATSKGFTQLMDIHPNEGFWVNKGE